MNSTAEGALMKLWFSMVVLACWLGWAGSADGAGGWKVPAVMKKLPNGLVVVVSEDHSAPTFGLCISYGIGFRLEPEGRMGFAHLFEHMMFEGTPNAPKGTFDRVLEGGGGSINGDTRFDFTEYVDTAPVSALEPTLWLEADRLKTLDFSPANLENQRKVVEEEVRVNVLNQPYGLFYAIDLPGKAFDKFPNMHNFYGEFKDLDTAKIQDVEAFFNHYYAPNNAILAIAGDVQPEQAFALVEKYFGSLAPRQVSPKPDVTEAPQTAERRFSQQDKLARVPALAIGYRMPPRRSRDAVIGALIGELLHNGQASLLYQALVKDKKVALEVSGGINFVFGTPFEFDGPTLLTSFIVYSPNLTENDVLSAYDAVLSDLTTRGPSPAALERISAKMRSDWYANLEIPVSRASILAHATLFDGNPDRVNEIPEELERVTPQEVRAFAGKYLIKANRTLIDRVPAPTAGSKNAGGEEGAH
jgi:predicted Zn-dependent peptidase